ncbi:transglycosylase domain-containing protein [Roseicitreum antarcticum]|nr:transglycosylase domain-containing protein [Roseicitreum antarcticum]
MTISITKIFVAVAVFAGPTAALADKTFPFLEHDAIRFAYETEAASWSTAPVMIVNAFVAAEDRTFFQSSSSRSTIPLFVAGWYPEPSFPNKRVIAFAVSQALEREEILDWYVHRVFLGQGCFGVDQAALAYFGKSTVDLELHEAAFLAGIPKAPSAFHPIKEHDRAISRRNFVLSEMAHVGFISEQAAHTSTAEPLIVRQPLGSCP